MKNDIDNLVIFGSPKNDSFTAKLLKTVTSSLSGKTVYYNCFEASPFPCDACNLCVTQNACKYKDLDEFFNQFENAKHIIFAFPIYNGSFPAPLKALIDRFQRFYSARFSRNIKPPMKGNRLCTLVITKGSNKDLTPLILEQLSPVFTICGCKLKKTVVLKNTDSLTVHDTFYPIITEYN